MKLLRYSRIGIVVIVCLSPLLLPASSLVANQLQAPKQEELTAAAARAEIESMYDAWGRARVELDREKMESILAPDFYVLLYGQKISREQFISDISRESPGSRLTRFDTEILTVQKTEKGWTVVIAEKLEVAILGSGGKEQKLCSLWVTRDGWRKEGPKWLVTFSEAIGHEGWGPDVKTPIKDW
jgi:hypothetical protein